MKDSCQISVISCQKDGRLKAGAIGKGMVKIGGKGVGIRDQEFDIEN